MKIIRAQFENFRLLRDLTLDFSTDKTLTVIRAENESGKTTILNGLQWALYGDIGLPHKGKDYRLHPLDWQISDGAQIPISAEVEFEIKSYRRRGSGETKKRYRIIRAGHVTLSQDGNTDKVVGKLFEVKLFELTNSGSLPIEPPEAFIRKEILPPELKEVFFTDGDRALSFIEGDESSIRQRRVRDAIRSLLGLEIIETTLGHADIALSEFNREAKPLKSDERLPQIVEELEQIEKTSRELQNEIEESKPNVDKQNERLNKIRKDIEDVLVKGDAEKLNSDIKETDGQVKQLDKELNDAAQEHSRLLSSMSLSCALLAPTLKKSLEKLNALHKQGEISTATIPVLAEYLEGTTCICGESLDSHTTYGKQRRGHIQSLINENQNADALKNRLTELYFDSRHLQKEIHNDKRWIAEYDKIANCQDKLESERDKQGKKLGALQAQLEIMPDTNIQKLRAAEEKLIALQMNLSNKLMRAETRLEGLVNERKRLILERDNQLREQRKGAYILAKLDVVRDVQSVLKKSSTRITNEERKKVSRQMNEIFLEMIGSEPEQGAIIQKAEINKDFDILAYGENNQEIPVRDLNGASRRALTFAFILALTKVSEVEAPNVIDTPLGMMSGFVKRAALKTAIRESAQLILFLTRAEIAECEDILDAEAGYVITLTNTAHYPKILVNNPEEKERKIIRCECNHRSECRVCKRRINVEEDKQPIS